MTNPPVQWTSPIPMWSVFDAANRTAMNQPIILRFDSDYYMEELLSMLQHEPHRLPEWQAQPETWRIPAVTPTVVKPLPQFAQVLLKSRLAEVQSAANTALPVNAEPDTDAPQSLKLYQPGQMRHYLITADLICRVPGLPHKRFNTPTGERAVFVLRRLLPRDNPSQAVDSTFQFNTATCDEYAYVRTPRGEQWRKVSTPDLMAEGEERLPMFVMPYAESPNRQRRILGGVIPVGRRERYVNASLNTDENSSPYDAPESAMTALPDKRLVLFQMLVTEPWRRLREGKNVTLTEFATGRFPELDVTPPVSGMSPRDLQNLQDRVQMQSWYILLDLKEFLQRYVPRIAAALKDIAPAGLDLTNERPLYDWLTNMGIAQALRSLDAAAISKLEAATQNFVDNKTANAVWDFPAVTGNTGAYPTLRFLLVDHTAPTNNQAALTPHDPLPTNSPLQRERLVIRPDDFNPGDTHTYPVLEQLLLQALPAQVPARTPPVAEATKAALEVRPRVAAWFVIRCVFERPNCVPYEPELVSSPTVPFQMASFYDPDAPSRPIRIAMPDNTTLNGLRKHQKNTLFMLSEMLCGQVEKVRSFSFMDLVLSVLPWPFHKGLPGGEPEPCGDPGMQFGMILSLSIPIIAIAGLILLIIIVSLLDQIFRWLPYFITLIPIVNVSTESE